MGKIIPFNNKVASQLKQERTSQKVLEDAEKYIRNYELNQNLSILVGLLFVVGLVLWCCSLF